MGTFEDYLSGILPPPETGRTQRAQFTVEVERGYVVRLRFPDGRAFLVNGDRVSEYPCEERAG